MKKILKILITITFILSSLTYFYYIDSNQAIGKFSDFDKFVNLVDYNDEDIRDDIAKAASDNNINLIKFVKKSRVGKKENMDVDAYLFLSDPSSFNKSHKDLKINEDFNTSNKFDSISSNNLLTKNNIDIKKYEDIDIDNISGDYAISGNQNNVESFIDDLKAYADIVQTPDYMSTSEMTMKEFFLILVINLISIFATIFALLIYNRSLVKELSISLLFGYDDKKISASKSIGLMAIPILITLIIDSALLFSLVSPDSIGGFLIAMNPMYIFILLFALVIFLLEFILLLYKTNHEDILSVLKGERKVSAKFLSIFKIIFAGSLAYLLAITFFSLKDYKDVNEYLSDWDDAKSYANIATGTPWQYVVDEDDYKYKELVAKPTEDLARLLIDRGAVLFLNPYQDIEGLNIDDDMFGEYKLNNGSFAFINHNYLTKFDILDDKGRALDTKAKENEWVILVPEDTKLTDQDLEDIKEKQIFESKNSDDLVENIVKIKSDQKLPSLDSRARIDQPYADNYVYILINEDGLNSEEGLLSKGLVNWQLHPYLDKGDESLGDLKELISTTPASKYVLWIETAYDYVEYQVQRYKNETIIYIIASIILIYIYWVIVKTDHKNYYLNYGDEAAVKSLFGYPFKDIHKAKIRSMALSYLLALAIYYIVLRLSVMFGGLGFYTPREGWTNGIVLIGFGLSFLLFIICTIIEVDMLRKDGSLIKKFKGG
ncbi:hypothetical protein [Anaerococcus provencensis]|uniref:hypothetical protein n=1 Tax=Anaerococcus provencensis TaxID=938293 RepID=UPI00030D93D3|nr:hypothetical protein [Anaerococcus provencensis]